MFQKNIFTFKYNLLIPLFLGWVSLGWIDPLADKVREGNQLYHRGKYDEALGKYVDAQIGSPDSISLDFNMADAQYKRNKYDEAAQLFEKVIKSGDLETKAKSGFNMGNTLYRQGKMKEALEWYKKTIDFIDEAEPKAGSELDALRNDTKHNYEYVDRKMKENEQKQQGQDQKNQQEEEDSKDKKEDQDQNNDGKGEDKEKQEPQDDKQQAPKPEDTQDKDKDKDKNDKSQSQTDKDRPKNQQEEKQQPHNQGQKQMTKEEAERFLEALNHAEKETRLMMRDTQRQQHKSVEKDW